MYIQLHIHNDLYVQYYEPWSIMVLLILYGTLSAWNKFLLRLSWIKAIFSL